MYKVDAGSSSSRGITAFLVTTHVAPTDQLDGRGERFLARRYGKKLYSYKFTPDIFTADAPATRLEGRAW